MTDTSVAVTEMRLWRLGRRDDPNEWPATGNVSLLLHDDDIE